MRSREILLDSALESVNKLLKSFRKNKLRKSIYFKNLNIKIHIKSSGAVIHCY